jgi:hypothetical protein
VDSQAHAKSRAHLRLASLGRLRPRGSIHASTHHHPAGTVQRHPSQRGETLVPVSPSDASSQPRSNTSTLSNVSSETTLSDAKSDDLKSLDDRPAAAWSPRAYSPASPGYDTPDDADADAYPPVTQHTPRMMHQTSSRLLRMTEDDRPFTRVRIASPAQTAGM